MKTILIWLWACIIMVIVVSLLGFLFPYLIVQESKLDGKFGTYTKSNLFILTKCFAIGVIFGVSFMHLFVDAVEYLEALCDYPGLGLEVSGCADNL